jgi:hypothetical protein
MRLIMAIGEKGMRYYPAFGVKSGRDALFRRFFKGLKPVFQRPLPLPVIDPS